MPFSFSVLICETRLYGESHFFNNNLLFQIISVVEVSLFEQNPVLSLSKDH